MECRGEITKNTFEFGRYTVLRVYGSTHDVMQFQKDVKNSVKLDHQRLKEDLEYF